MAVRYLTKKCERMNDNKNSHYILEDTPESYRKGMFIEKVMVIDT